jgi:hypothetical protein
MERETGIEPATNSLEGCDSTIELLPRSRVFNILNPIVAIITIACAAVSRYRVKYRLRNLRFAGIVEFIRVFDPGVMPMRRNALSTPYPMAEKAGYIGVTVAFPVAAFGINTPAGRPDDER